MITRLQLQDFRCYESLDATFEPGSNHLIGPNGAGKTNVLEAIYFLAVARSPRTAREADLVRQGAEGFRIAAETDDGHTIAVTYRPHAGRSWSVDRRRAKNALGHLTVVFFSPDDLWLVKGGPSGRRGLLDRLLMQARPLHADQLAAYEEALTQRNALLREVKARRAGKAMLEVWEEQLVEYGVAVTVRRSAIAEELGSRAAGLHERLAPGESLSCTYVSGIDSQNRDPALLRAEFAAALAGSREREIDRGFTLIGPHRDDWSILVNGLPLRGYGSQGQQRTAVLALKLAERAALEAETGRPPVLLLDDVLSELDSGRRDMVRRLTEGDGQAFLTSTEPEGRPTATYHVGGGRLTPAL
ncbi:MAG TPA: DNA replication/repair protein RecF [Bacillota bacterium]|nr:DNA replication/repair protein RecF [Bacillota bacterium]